jgi:SRSO17 transposase
MVEEGDPAEELFAAFHARFAPFFVRAEVRERSRRYLRALLGSVERKNGWQLAEAMGEHDPNGAQRLLFEAVWDADAVRDELERFVAEQFGDRERGIFVLDESGFPKKGTKSVGVKRQYCGTVGKRENCQVGVFLTYGSSRGHVFLDRRLYLPEEWAADAERRQEAGVPKDVTFQTKPALGRAMLEHAWALGVQGGWLTGDEVYGSDSALRRQAEQHCQAYVLTVRANEAIWWWSAEQAPGQVRVADLVAQRTPAEWTRLSAGQGSKGPRWYDWTRLRLLQEVPSGWSRWLMARRSITDPTELAYYLAFAPAGTSLQTLVQVAGARWTVEQCLEEAKGEGGLDQYQVRSWQSWHRHMTLVLLAHTFLAWLQQAAAERGEKRRPGGGEHISAGGEAAAGSDVASCARDARDPAGLVGMATPASAPSPVLSLPTPRRDRLSLTPSTLYVRL